MTSSMRRPGQEDSQSTRGLNNLNRVPLRVHIKGLVAEWIHFTLLGIVLPTIKLKV